MSNETRRTHVIIPDRLLQEVDELVGRRRRSEFFTEAAREKVARERLRQAAHELAGSLREERIPEWETPEAASAWVRSLRADNEDGALSADSPQ